MLYSDFRLRFILIDRIFVWFILIDRIFVWFILIDRIFVWFILIFNKTVCKKRKCLPVYHGLAQKEVYLTDQGLSSHRETVHLSRNGLSV